MKKIILVLSLVLTTVTPAHGATIVGCEGVKRDAKVVKGAYVQCLANTDLAIFESLRGPMVVNFWGSWCGPCEDELPYLRTFYSKYGKKYPLVGVDVEEATIENGRTFAANQKMAWPNYFDYSGSTKKITGIGVPVTVFIDAKGKIVYKKIGVLNSYKELVDLAKKYLK